MTRVWGGGAALAALAGVCAAALIAAALVAASLLTPRTWALAVGAPGDAYFVTNSFPPEGEADAPLRWTREATELRAYGAYAGPALVELRLYRDGAGTVGRRGPAAGSLRPAP
ncbi:MAG: hypothetical protein HGA45_24365 [Chloroflexales bacterium]|nr:hypothetical protein [Chloroflexales bacterium]